MVGTEPVQCTTIAKPITCRAAVSWAPKEPLKIETITVAPPKRNEVRIKIIATGVCHTDWFTIGGSDPEGFVSQFFIPETQPLTAIHTTHIDCSRVVSPNRNLPNHPLTLTHVYGTQSLAMKVLESLSLLDRVLRMSLLVIM